MKHEIIGRNVSFSLIRSTSSMKNEEKRNQSNKGNFLMTSNGLLKELAKFSFYISISVQNIKNALYYKKMSNKNNFEI